MTPLRSLAYWAAVVALSAALALRIDLRVTAARPLSPADAAALAACRPMTPIGALRALHQRLADPCGAGWLESQLPPFVDVGWQALLRRDFYAANGDDQAQLHLAVALLHLDAPVPVDVGPLVRRHPDDPHASLLLTQARPGEAWLDPVLEDQAVVLAWARRGVRPDHPTTLLRRLHATRSPLLGLAVTAALWDVDLRPGLHTEEGSRGREGAATAWLADALPSDVLSRALAGDITAADTARALQVVLAAQDAQDARDPESLMGADPPTAPTPPPAGHSAALLVDACGESADACSAWIRRFGRFIARHPSPAAALASVAPDDAPAGDPWRTLTSGAGPPCARRWVVMILADLADLAPQDGPDGVRLAGGELVTLPACAAGGALADAALAELAASHPTPDVREAWLLDGP